MPGPFDFTSLTQPDPYGLLAGGDPTVVNGGAPNGGYGGMLARLTGAYTPNDMGAGGMMPQTWTPGLDQIGPGGGAGSAQPQGIGAALAPKAAAAPAAASDDDDQSGIGGMIHNVSQFFTKPDDNGLSFTDRLSRFGAQLQDISEGGDRASKIQAGFDKRQSDADQEKSRQRLWAMAQQVFPGDPKAQLAFLVAPEKTAETVLSAYQTRPMQGGETLHTPGQPDYTAPKIDVMGDTYGVGRIGSDGSPVASYSAPRPESYAETNAANTAASVAAQAAARLAETQRHDRATENLGQGNLAVKRGREGRIGAKGAGKGAAGLPAGFVVEQ